MSFLSALLQSGAILLREGLEALLVLAALAAVLRKSNATHALKSIYLGAAAAILVSLGLALVFEYYYGGEHDDRIEAAVMFVAAGLMLYMSGWLYIRQDGRALVAELTRDAGRALATGTMLSLAGLAFLAVLREGAETILFLHALAKTAGGWSLGLLAGILGAAAVLAALFVAMQWLAVKVPTRPVFLVTSAFLFVMGLRFVAGGIQELQEQALVPFHPAADTLANLFAFIGANASWETIGAQLALTAAAGLSLLFLRRAAAA